MGNRIVKIKKLGLPKSSKEAFLLLSKAGIISSDIAEKMAKIVGFRNTIVHQYREMNIDILTAVIENCLGDFEEYTKSIIKSLENFDGD